MRTRKINDMLRSQNDFASNWVNTKKFGLNLVRYFASKVWNNKVKISGSVEIFKVGLVLFSKICFICFLKRILKMIKNAIYFILKALFVLKIFKFLSLLIRHVQKTVKIYWLQNQLWEIRLPVTDLILGQKFQQNKI